jgi:hypothetical protein
LCANPKIITCRVYGEAVENDGELGEPLGIHPESTPRHESGSRPCAMWALGVPSLQPADQPRQHHVEDRAGGADTGSCPCGGPGHDPGSKTSTSRRPCRSRSVRWARTWEKV